MRIGTFRAAGGGYSGQLQTLSLSIELSLVPAEPSDSENAPDFRVVAGEDEDAREIGAGWKHVGEKAGDYVSVQIDDPAFVQPLWDETQLIERLSRTEPRYAGRRQYWFDLLHFTPDWFQTRFAITRQALGTRYTPELNIDLPIRRGLLTIARDPSFIESLTRLADDIDEARHRATDSIARLLAGGPAAAPAADLDIRFRTISGLIRTASIGPADPVPFDPWIEALDTASATLGTCSSAIWDLHTQQDGDRDEVRRVQFHVEQLYETIEKVSEGIKRPVSRLANEHRLLVTGEAGTGKSHLLADVANHHIDQGFPAVLVLGGSFVDREPWRQVADQLGLTNTTPDELLGTLDAAGEAAGTRALVMIDAINERGGIALWANRLAAFLATADRFSHVAVILSCRTTFLPYILREIDEKALPRIAHPGFAGQAAQAAQRYLDARGIVRMAAPNFSPEFENPLAIANATLAAAIGLGLRLWIAGVVIFALGHMVSVWAARRDPQFVDVARRHLRFPTFLRV